MRVYYWRIDFGLTTLTFQLISLSLISFISLCLFNITYAQSFEEDSRENIQLKNISDLSDLYSRYREAKSDPEKRDPNYEIFRREREKERDISLQICPHCPPIRELTSGVNDILQHMAEEKQSRHPFLTEEVGRLEGMFYAQMKEVWEPGEEHPRTTCQKYSLDKNLSNDFDFDHDNAILIFQEDMNLPRATMLQLREGESRTYFMRGRGSDRDRIIRVDINRGEPARVSYYRMVTEHNRHYLLGTEMVEEEDEGYEVNYPRFPKYTLNQDEFLKEEHTPTEENEDGPIDALEENEWGFMRASHSQEESGETEVTYGLAIEHQSGLPRNARLLDVRNTKKLGENLMIKSSATVDSREQGVRVALTGQNDQTYVEIYTKGEDPEMRIPYNLIIGEGNFSVRGDVRAQRRERRLSMSVVSMDTEFVELRLKEEGGESTYSITHNSDFQGGRAGTLSIGYERSSDSSNIERGRDHIWVRYGVKF